MHAWRRRRGREEEDGRRKRLEEEMRGRIMEAERDRCDTR